MNEAVIQALVWILPVVIAVTLHEAAHGYAALSFGDDTAKTAGRLSLNPFRHIDPVGTLLIPGVLWLTDAPFLFGYAKPVPVDFDKLRPLRPGMACVALAGPAANVALALLGGLLLQTDAFIRPEQAPAVFQGLILFLQINCVLAVFNMLPVLPLDGGRVLAALLPESLRAAHAKTERFGLPIVILLLLAPWATGIPVTDIIIGDPAFGLMRQIMALTGNGSLG